MGILQADMSVSLVCISALLVVSVLASQKIKAWTIEDGYYRDQGKLLVKEEIKLIMWTKLCDTG